MGKIIIKRELRKLGYGAATAILYADGGVIRENPSRIGGTFAVKGVNARDETTLEVIGIVEASDDYLVTNNQTEQIAIVIGLEMMPDGWCGTVCSDSQIALGRIFKGWATSGLDPAIILRTKNAVRRLGRIEHVLLQGHPTKADLASGIGKKRNLPVSIHNVWCDKRCHEEAHEYLTSLGELEVQW